VEERIMRERIVDAAMEIAAGRRWEDVTLEAIALRADISLSGIREHFDGRLSILDAFAARIDRAVLDGLDADLAEEAPRERLFDVLFTRIEALRPHREAIANLLAAARRDPLLALALNGLAARSMAWMLTGAGISSQGLTGAMRAQALALQWRRVLGTFIRDDDVGLARTMAELDRRLRQAERAVIRFERACRFIAGADRRERGRPPEDVAEGHPS
jgi:AcrR family transcriptional regulator